MAGKKDTKANGDPSGLRAAGAKAAAEAARMTQTVLPIGRETYTEHVTMPVVVPVSDAEADLLNARVADLTSEAMSKEAELKARKESMIDPLAAEIKGLRKDADQAAKEAGERKRTVEMRIAIEYHPATGMKRYLNPETGKQVKVDEAMTPDEVDRYSAPVQDPDADGPVLTPPDEQGGDDATAE